MNQADPPPPIDDGLPKMPVHLWSSKQKHYYLRRYLHAFMVAMKNKKQWEGLHYVDLFAGPGMVELGPNKLALGSPLIAAHTQPPFTQLHLCEKNPEYCQALRTRLSRLNLPKPPQIIQGDANDSIDEILGAIPERTLSVAFLDPYGLHLRYSTLQAMAARCMDMLIYFADQLDAVRNCMHYYQHQPNDNLTLTLGTRDWLDIPKKHPADQWGTQFALMYQEQLKKLGYKHFNTSRVNRSGQFRLYKLIFCSKGETGKTIWDGITKKDFDGQRRLFD